MTRIYLTPEADVILQETVKKVRQMSPNSYTPQRRGRQRKGGVGAGGSVRLQVVLIDRDISGILDHDPQSLLVAEDIELTEQEISDGYTIKLQEPADVDYDTNLVESLNLWPYKRCIFDAKYYEASPLLHSGEAVGGSGITITLEADSNASLVDDFYNGDTILLPASEQSAVITDYDAETRLVTVGVTFDPAPTSGTIYQITSVKNQKLATTIINDTENFQKIVRYATIPIWWDDGPLKLGTYGRADYPDFDENEDFPEEGDLPEGYLTKRYRGLAINGVLTRRHCSLLPPPVLPEEVP